MRSGNQVESQAPEFPGEIQDFSRFQRQDAERAATPGVACIVSLRTIRQTFAVR